MERRIKSYKTISAILTSDWHLREDTPVCRTDDYWLAQWQKVDFISDLQKKYDCPILHGGDLFDHWKPSPNLLRETILHIPDQFFTVYGQHCLPAHSLELVDKCGINVLQAAGKLTILEGCHWGQNPTKSSLLLNNKSILVWHKMVWKDKKPYPTCTDLPASITLDKYKYDLLLFGDNHKTFTETLEGRVLVNPGSMMRMDADQVDHRPCVFLWFAEDNTVEQVFIPIEQGVISREHLEIKEQRETRIDAYVERLNDDWEVALSFEHNVEAYKEVNEVRPSVLEIVYKAMETKKAIA
jgi:DNA repair exonuclease SbcCD nuclease subunit